MDPVLAKRLAQQQQKTLTGESAVENLGRSSQGAAAAREGGDLSHMDPKLAKRLSVQRQKVTDVEGAAADDGGSAAPAEPAKGREEREQTGSVEIADPVLARRLAQQRDKVKRGDSAVERVGSVAERVTRIDSALLERLSVQQQKALAGESEAVGLSARLEKKPSGPYSMVAGELAEKLSKRRQKEAAAEAPHQLVPENPQSGEEKEDEAGKLEAAATEEPPHSALEAPEDRGAELEKKENEAGEGGDVRPEVEKASVSVACASSEIRQQKVEKVPSLWQKLGASLCRCCS